jgi:translation initiation factor eIF-2B subunit epsilon
MKVQVVVSRSSMSMGDVIRELDTKSLLTSDFVLVNGDVVSNLELKPILKQHQLRKQQDKNTIMTMVLKQGQAIHGARGPPAVFAIEPSSSRCVQYIPLPDPTIKEFQLDAEMIEKTSVFQLHNNLIDCGIDICTLEVPALFSENFDYQDMRSDFVRGILESDLFVKSIYTHFISHDYAVRIRSTQIYDRVSRDILCRWAYPLVPGFFSENSVSFSRNHVYREKPVLLSRTTQLQRNVLLGAGSTVGSGSRLENCVVGRNCMIGNNVYLCNAYLWDNVTIGDDCQIYYSILASGVQLKNQVSIEKGCLLGQGVVIGHGRQLEPFTFVYVNDEENGTHYVYVLKIVMDYFW